jgi:uncharacterized protein YjiS (DUF1127 family)
MRATAAKTFKSAASMGICTRSAFAEDNNTVPREPLSGLQVVRRLSVMQFSQVAERGERQHGNQRHIILSRDSGIIKFRFSVCRASHHILPMLRHTTSQQLKMTGVVAQAAFKLVSGIRLMARFVSCYVQTVHERNELWRLDYRSLRDIGLTTDDVEKILRRPIMRRCWRSVNSCKTDRCRNSIICIADCRVTPHLFH